MLKFDNSYYKVNNLPLIKFINQLDDKLNNNCGSLVHIDILDNHLFLDIYDNVLTLYAVFLNFLGLSDINYIKLNHIDYIYLSNLFERDTISKDNNLSAGSSYLLISDDNSFVFVLFDIQRRLIVLRQFELQSDILLDFDNFLTLLKGKLKWKLSLLF